MSPHILEEEYFRQHFLVNCPVWDRVKWNMKAFVPLLTDCHLLTKSSSEKILEGDPLYLKTLIFIDHPLHPSLEDMAAGKFIPKFAHKETIQLILKLKFRSLTFHF